MADMNYDSHSYWSGSASKRWFMKRLHLDWPLTLGLALLSVVGLFILYSASGQDLASIERQAIRLGLAFAVMIVVAQINPYHFQRWAPLLFSLGIILLLAVLLFGVIGKGAQRWLNFGFVRFQPSELMKIIVPMMIAWYMADRPLPPRPKRVFGALVLILAPTLLIAKQPDLGTSLLIASAGLWVLFLSGIRKRTILWAILAALAFAPALWMVMHDYQRSRVLMFLNPQNDPLGAGYHIIQSKIAIGSGGIYGKGWLNGSQSQLEFLPERSTDFIFAVFSEEFGLLGVLLLLGLYLFIIIRGLYIATQAQTSFNRLLSGSLVLTFFVYIFVNIGMVTGLLPVVGVPLPLVSYGGTSMVTLMAAFGILMSIHTHRRLLVR